MFGIVVKTKVSPSQVLQKTFHLTALNSHVMGKLFVFYNGKLFYWTSSFKNIFIL